MFSFIKKSYLLKSLFVCVLFSSYTAHGQQGDTNYPSLTDNALGYAIINEFPVEKFDGNSTNWFVQQHRNGTIFLSNANGFYSFDGATWRRHFIAEKAEVRQFVIVGDRIYIGVQSELGYFAAEKNGVLKYHSLLPELTTEQHRFSEVNNVYQFNGKIYFVSPEQIMVYTINDGFKIWQPNVRFSRAWLAQDKLFFTDGSTLNYFYDGKRFKVFGFENKHIKKFGFVEKTTKGYLIGTFSQGIYLWTSDTKSKHSVSSWLASDDLLAHSGFYNSTRINETTIAVASINNGVFFFNRQGAVIYHLNRDNGLPVNITLNLFLDKQKGLWLMQEGALVRVQLPFLISTFSTKQSNIAKVRSFARSSYLTGSKLFFSAVNGIFTLDDKGKVSLYPDVITSTAKIIPFKQNFLIAGAQQCQMLDPAEHKIDTLYETAYCKDIYLTKHHENEVFLISELGILHSHWTESQWTKPEILMEDNQINSALVEDKYGDVWSSNNLGELIRFYFDKTWQVEKFNVSENSIQVMELNGQLLIATNKGLFHWESAHENQQIQALGNKVTWFHDYFGSKADAPFFIYQDKHQRLWVATSEQSGYFHINKENEYIDWSSFPVTASGMHNLRSVLDEKNQTWLGFDNGIVRYQPDENNTISNASVRAVISELKLNNIDKTVNLNILKHSIVALKLNANESGLRIFFGLSNYLQGQNNQFRYKLNNQQWTPWSEEYYADLGKLSGGEYQLAMQAKDPHHTVFSANKMLFEIIPPWYLSRWAYIFYSLLLLSVIFFVSTVFAKIKTKKLVAAKYLLEQQVSERTLTIQKQADELVKLDEAKSRFFANVSHEFRTPLTLAISPLKELLKHDRIYHHQDRKYIQVAIENSQQMLALVGQILDINRLETGEMKLAISEIKLGEAVHNIVQRFKVSANKQKVQLHEIGLDQAGSIWFDSDHLIRIVSNLLSNAIKFSPENSQIDIGIKFNQNENTVCLWVNDQGSGIPADDLPYLYDRFHQGINSSNSFQPGTGIGLSMVKELLELHQGKIELEQSNHKGCLFRVTLINDASHYTADQFVDADKTIDQVSCQNTSMIELESFTPSSAEKSLQPTVLVVDDHEDLRMFIRNTLQTTYTVITASQGLQALQIVAEHQPDFIISDVMMPVMDGFELATKLKENADTAHIPLLLLTAKSTKRETVEGLQCVLMII